MRRFLVPTIAAASLFALPAFAQSNSNSQTSNNSPPAPGELQKALQQDLSKAGYTDIQIVPGSFLVQAKDSKGNPTQMVISPNAMTAVTAMSPQSGSGNSGSSGTSSAPGR